MKILISNDDGYQALGIIALYEALKDLPKLRWLHLSKITALNLMR